MRTLPSELKFQLALETAIDSLSVLCSSSQEYYNICISESFWKEKFREINLIPLEKGSDLITWKTIYKASLLAAQRAKININAYRNLIKEEKEAILFEINTYSITSPKVISLPGISTEVIEKHLEESRYLGQIKEIKHTLKEFRKEKEEGYTKGKYYTEEEDVKLLSLQPQVSQKPKLRIFLSTDGEITYNLLFTQSSLGPGMPKPKREYQKFISLEDVQFLLYKLFYFGQKVYLTQVTHS